METNPTETTFLWLSTNFCAKHLLTTRNEVQLICWGLNRRILMLDRIGTAIHEYL